VRSSFFFFPGAVQTPKSNLSKNLKKLIQKHPLQVLGLTGTPMQVNLVASIPFAYLERYYCLC